jgi:hypothetical protein
MPTLRETILTTLARDDAFAFIADFAHSAIWDPGTATSDRIGDGPVGTGARYRLGVRMRGRVSPMEYRITDFDPPRRVVLAGSGSGVRATDDISFETTPGGTRIEYVAEIHLTGWMRLLEPFVGGAFAKIGREARDGMTRALDERARATASGTATTTAPAPAGTPSATTASGAA